MNNNIINKLYEIIDEKNIILDADMARYTSFRAGGKAVALVEPESIDKLKAVLTILTEEKCPHMILGNGSNILVRDSGYDGVFIKMGKGFDFVNVDGDGLECGCAALMSVVAKEALANSLRGFEFASGIPGSIGGAVFMNAGAYGGEIVDIIESVHVVSKDGKRDFVLTKDDLDMGYRHSIFHETEDVIVSAKISLTKGNPDEIKEKMTELSQKRNSKQPVQYPSAGSTFKRPEGYFAGKLIQDAGCKGLMVGGAQVSELHSGFIINRNGATATDIIQLMDVVKAKVFNDFGVTLEPEVRIIG